MEFVERVQKAISIYIGMMVITKNKYPTLLAETEHLVVSYLVYPVEDASKELTLIRAAFQEHLNHDLDSEVSYYYRGDRTTLTLHGGYVVTELEYLHHWISAFKVQCGVTGEGLNDVTIMRHIRATLLALAEVLRRIGGYPDVTLMQRLKAESYLKYLED